MWNFLFLILLIPQTLAYVYNFTILVSSTTNLNLWFSFDVSTGNQSPWQYIGPLGTGNHSFVMTTNTQVAGTSTGMEQIYRFYFGSYGNLVTSPLTVNKIVFHWNGNNSEENNNIWDGSGIVNNNSDSYYNFSCITDSSSCCIARFVSNTDDVDSALTSSPCNDTNTFNFVSNREGTIPTTEPTSAPTDIPIAQPSATPIATPTGFPSESYTLTYYIG